MTLQEFFDTSGMSLTYATTSTNPHMPDFKGDHYIVGLEIGDQIYTLPFSKGTGLNGAAPTPLEVLECLQLDAQMLGNTDSFEDFCDELGYDPDSRKAFRVYQACLDQTARLKTFMGEELFEQFLSCEED